MSNITKRALSHALKTLVSQYPLNKLTIKHITVQCGINRQTFYFHFRDIYDLVEWTYAEEASSAIGNVRTAMEAVYALLKVDRGVPEVFNSVYDIRVLMDSTFIQKLAIEQGPEKGERHSHRRVAEAL